jgi:nicotinamide-nucleotide amidase
MATVKHGVLGVRPGPVVSREAAIDMARGVARLLDADLAVAVTGVGGPDSQEGQAPGTVWIAVFAGDRGIAELHRFDGDPSEVCDRTCDAAMTLLARVVRPDRPRARATTAPR